MNALLLFVAFLILGGLLMLAPAYAGSAILLTLPLVAAVSWAIYRVEEDRRFLIRFFICALLIRLLIGALI